MTFINARKGAALALVGLMLVAVVPMASTSSEGLLLQVMHWEQGTAMPSNLSQSAVVEDGNGLIYVMGGQKNGTSTALAECWVYDTADDAWTRIADMNVATRGAAVTMGADGKIYVFGGAGLSGKLGTIQIYDPATNEWTTSAMTLPQPVWEAKAWYREMNDMFYIIGGERNGEFGGSYTVQYVTGDLSFSSEYLSGGNLLPYKRLGGSIVPAPTNDRIWYFGGTTSDYDTLGSYVIEYNPSASTWNDVTIMPDGTCGGGAVRGADGVYYMYGGSTSAWNYGEATDSGQYYDPYANEWGTIPDMVQATKYFGYAATSDGRIWAIGGNNGSDPAQMVPTVQSFDVLDVTLTVPASVKTGEPFMAKVSVWAPYTSNVRYVGSAYVKDGSGTTYGVIELSSPDRSSFAFEVTLPFSATSGNYTLWVSNFYQIFDSLDSYRMPDQSTKLVVVSQAAISDQIASLEAQIADLQAQVDDGNQALQDQITALQTQLSTLKAENTKLQSSVDTKADSTLGYLTIVLLVVIIVLVALMMMRRKP